MLASSWAQIYSLYIRLPSQNRRKRVQQKRMVLSDRLGARNLPKRYTEYFLPDTSSPLGSQTALLTLRAAPSKRRPANGMNTLNGIHLCVKFLSHGSMATFLPSESSNRRKEKSCTWGTHSDAVVIYENIPIAQHTPWEPNKHPDKLQMVAKSYAEK